MRRQRPLWSRALVAIWGIWFAAALLEPGGLHSCPLHSGAGHVHGGMSAMHDMHATPSATHTTDSPSHRSKDVCTCLGLCCCAPAVALASRVATLPVLSTFDVGTLAHREFSAPSLRRAHALPFANGPPTLVG